LVLQGSSRAARTAGRSWRTPRAKHARPLVAALVSQPSRRSRSLSRTMRAKATARSGLSIERTVNEPSWSDAERQRLIETLRKAGVPPCATEDELKAADKPVRLPECQAKLAG